MNAKAQAWIAAALFAWAVYAGRPPAPETSDPETQPEAPDSETGFFERIVEFFE